METQARRVLQDQNMTLDFKGNGVNENTRVLRSKKNASLGGRKALADLSNAAKPHVNNAKKKVNESGARGEIGAYKPTSPVSGKTSVLQSGKQSTIEGSRKVLSTKLNALDGNLKTSKPLSPGKGKKINVFVEHSDSELSSVLQTQKKNHLGAEIGNFSVSKTISSGGGVMPLTHEVLRNSNFTTKSKEGSRKELAAESSNGFRENIVQKMESSSKGLKSSVEQSVDNHICNAKGRVGGRKALADISNSSSTNMQQASRLGHSKNLKAIADEQFLHDHQQCINVQKGEMDMKFILTTLGLYDGPSQVLPSSIVLRDEVKEKIETPIKKWEDLDLAELQDEVQTPYRCTSPLLLNDCISSPESAMSVMRWNYGVSPKFQLIDTPLEK